LKIINSYAFKKNQIKYLKLPQNIIAIYSGAFMTNQIEILDLSEYLNLKGIGDDAFLDNPLKEIKILDNIKIEYDYGRDDLWNNFIIFYNDNDKKAGNYKLENDQWQWYPL
jgi:hypothetical protein